VFFFRVWRVAGRCTDSNFVFSIAVDSDKIFRPPKPVCRLKIGFSRKTRVSELGRAKEYRLKFHVASNVTPSRVKIFFPGAEKRCGIISFETPIKSSRKKTFRGSRKKGRRRKAEMRHLKGYEVGVGVQGCWSLEGVSMFGMFVQEGGLGSRD
jgi:hypothetical protein